MSSEYSVDDGGDIDRLRRMSEAMAGLDDETRRLVLDQLRAQQAIQEREERRAFLGQAFIWLIAGLMVLGGLIVIFFRSEYSGVVVSGIGAVLGFASATLTHMRRR